MNTSNLSDEITHALHRSWYFDPEAVHVRAGGGKVVLSGTMHSYHERQVAAETAWSAPGATDVENDIAAVTFGTVRRRKPCGVTLETRPQRQTGSRS